MECVILGSDHRLEGPPGVTCSMVPLMLFPPQLLSDPLPGYALQGTGLLPPWPGFAACRQMCLSGRFLLCESCSSDIALWVAQVSSQVLTNRRLVFSFFHSATHL